MFYAFPKRVISANNNNESFGKHYSSHAPESISLYAQLFSGGNGFLQVSFRIAYEKELIQGVTMRETWISKVQCYLTERNIKVFTSF